MPSILLSGPAGSGKSQEARRILRESGEPTIAADFQSIVAALLLLERDSEGRYPVRPEWVLPIAEYTRRAVIAGARTRQIDTVATNSDGDPIRRGALLQQLGPDAVEEVIDPGRLVVEARLTDPVTGQLSEECAGAVRRWFGRLR